MSVVGGTSQRLRGEQSIPLGATVPASCATSLSLLGEFRLGLPGAHHVPVSMGAQRLLVLLALRNRPVKRSVVAGTLWPEASQDRAYAALRAALARLHHVSRDVVKTTFLDISLTPNARVDLEESRRVAEHLLDRSTNQTLQSSGAERSPFCPPIFFRIGTTTGCCSRRRAGVSCACGRSRHWRNSSYRRSASATPPQPPWRRWEPSHCGRLRAPP